MIVAAIAQNPIRLYTHTDWKRRVKNTARQMMKNTSPEIIISLMLAVLENSLAGGRAAMSICFNFEYMKMYHTAPIARHIAIPILR